MECGRSPILAFQGPGPVKSKLPYTLQGRQATVLQNSLLIVNGHLLTKRTSGHSDVFYTGLSRGKWPFNMIGRRTNGPFPKSHFIFLIVRSTSSPRHPLAMYFYRVSSLRC